MSTGAEHESFVEFKNSFSYGARSDLSFKFLKGLPAEDAAQFFQELLYKLTDTFDDGELDRMVEHVFAWQARSYAGSGNWTYDEGPFTILQTPLREARVALLTSSGHFVDGDDPEPFGVTQMTQGEAAARINEFLKNEPQLSVIPAQTAAERLRVRHGGYDIRSAQADPNVVFPLERLRQLVGEGRIGELAANAYSFVGACAQTPLLKRSGPRWVQLLQAQAVDAAVLVPVWPVCHVSVGHVARLLEDGGIASVVISAAAFRDRLESMHLPRLVVTPHLMGRPMGMPGDWERQRDILLVALDLLEEAEEAGAVVEVPQAGVYDRYD